MQQPSVGVSVDPLKGRIRDADIRRIAGELPNWQLVAKKLDMGPRDIEDIETNRAPAEQRVVFLNRWTFRDETAATYKKLIEVLMSLGEQGAAERIAKLGQQPPMQQPSVGVSVDPLKGKIQGPDIRRIAGELPNWQLVATELGMGYQVIEGIVNNHRAAPTVEFLHQWIGNNGADATYEKLIEVLKSLGERGAAERIERICKQGQKPPPQPQPLPEPLPPPQPLPPQPLPFPQPLPPPQPLPIPQPLPPPQPQPDAGGLTSDCSPSQLLSEDDQPHTLYPSTWQPLQKYQQQYNLNGEGIVIAILDSGINQNHLAFTQQVHLAQSFISGESVEDTLGHGTMCAGIACGARFEGGEQSNWFGGIAPRAKLLVCKVVPNGSKSYNSTAVCQALDYIKNNHGFNSAQPVNVISLSFGSTYCDGEICDRIDTLVGAGVIVVCAASNEGRLTARNIAYPARLGNVLCIGSHSSSGKASSFSAVGKEIDFLAPGENVCAPSVGGRQALSGFNGTSCSTPAVAGLVCLVLQQLIHLSVPHYRRAHNVRVMREILKEMATSSGHHSEEHGFGCLVPAEFFEKTPDEKKRIISRMVQGV